MGNCCETAMIDVAPNQCHLLCNDYSCIKLCESWLCSCAGARSVRWAVCRVRIRDVFQYSHHRFSSLESNSSLSWGFLACLSLTVLRPRSSVSLSCLSRERLEERAERRVVKPMCLWSLCSLYRRARQQDSRIVGIGESHRTEAGQRDPLFSVSRCTITGHSTYGLWYASRVCVLRTSRRTECSDKTVLRTPAGE